MDKNELPKIIEYLTLKKKKVMEDFLNIFIPDMYEEEIYKMGYEAAIKLLNKAAKNLYNKE